MKKLLTILTIGLLLTGCANNGEEVVDIDPNSDDNISVNISEIEVFSNIKADPQSFDFGDIKAKDGEVSTTVNITNTGDFTIELYRLSTSCSCTTAELNMSDIAPRETREMKITFDPLFHPDVYGQIVRVVYLQTSDPAMPEIEIELTGNVI